MHQVKSVQINDTHKIIWDFEIQMDNQIPVRRPDLEIINKKESFFFWYNSLVRGLENQKSEVETRKSRLELCWDRLEYWKENKRPNETCWHLSNASGRPSANAGVKNSLEIIK